MPLITGFALTLVAGITMGFSIWPIKWLRMWKWENFWLVYTIAALIIAPSILPLRCCRICLWSIRL